MSIAIREFQEECFKGLADAIFTHGYCKGCKRIQQISARENSENCLDICCDACDAPIATLFKKYSIETHFPLQLEAERQGKGERGT